MGIMGTGGLIRNSMGDWIIGFSSNEGLGTVLLAELLAVKNGLTLAWKEGMRSVLCESDSLEVVQTLHDRKDYTCHAYAKYN